MQDFAFYNSGCGPARGARRGMVLARRALRRILRPMFFHMEQVCLGFQHQINGLGERHQRQMDDLRDQVSSASALGWDFVAMARRLALLEDQVEWLHQKLGTADQPQEWRPSIPLHPFPDERDHDLTERAAAEG